MPLQLRVEHSFIPIGFASNSSNAGQLQVVWHQLKISQENRQNQVTCFDPGENGT